MVSVSKISLLTLGVTINWCYGKLLARKISSLYVFRYPRGTKGKNKEGTDNTIIESWTALPCLLTSSQCVFRFSLSLIVSLSNLLFPFSPAPLFSRFSVTPSCSLNALRPRNKIRQQCSSLAFVPKFFARCWGFVYSSSVLIKSFWRLLVSVFWV